MAPAALVKLARATRRTVAGFGLDCKKKNGLLKLRGYLAYPFGHTPLGSCGGSCRWACVLFNKISGALRRAVLAPCVRRASTTPWDPPNPGGDLKELDGWTWVLGPFLSAFPPRKAMPVSVCDLSGSEFYDATSTPINSVEFGITTGLLHSFGDVCGGILWRCSSQDYRRWSSPHLGPAFANKKTDLA